jgi:hypothetical protein
VLSFKGTFHWHVLDPGSGPVSIKPKTPRLNSKVESVPTGSTPKSSTRLLDSVGIDDNELFTDKLKE